VVCGADLCGHEIVVLHLGRLAQVQPLDAGGVVPAAEVAPTGWRRVACWCVIGRVQKAAGRALALCGQMATAARQVQGGGLSLVSDGVADHRDCLGAGVACNTRSPLARARPLVERRSGNCECSDLQRPPAASCEVACNGGVRPGLQRH
jgi:hypothetical protein